MKKLTSIVAATALSTALMAAPAQAQSSSPIPRDSEILSSGAVNEAGLGDTFLYDIAAVFDMITFMVAWATYPLSSHA